MKNRVIPVLLILVTQTIVFLSIVPLGNAVTWSEETQLTSDVWSGDYSPALTQTSDGKIWLLWHRSPVSGTQHILYKTYNGIWSTEENLVNSLGNDINPAIIQTSDGKIWVFWTSDRKGPVGNYKIFYKTSSDNGNTWSQEIQLTNTAYTDRRPAVMQTFDNKLWVVWGRLAGNYDLYYKIHDNGSWSEEAQLTFDTRSDWEPSVVQSRNATIWVFWSSFRTDNYEIFYKTSKDNGVSWSNEAQLTVDTYWDEEPSVTEGVDGKIWVAWWRALPSKNNIYYRTYDGVAWSPSDIALVDSNTDDWLPAIYQSANKTMWVVWASNRFDDYDLFYKVTLPYGHDVGIARVMTSLTSQNVYRGFETPVKINVSVWNFGLNTENFQVTAYYNSTQIGAYIITLYPNSNVTKNFTLDTLSLTYGYYLIKVEASVVFGETDIADNVYNYGILSLTMPGDANADRIVDIFDVAELNNHWYDPPSVGRQGYDIKVDFNGDGRINIFDAALMNINWHKSW